MILELILAAILTEAITEVVVKSELFLPLREKIFNLGKNSRFFSWLHKLLDCGYCFSVWSGTFVAILFFRDLNLLPYNLDCFFIGVVLHRLSNLFHNSVDRLNNF